MHQLLSDQYIDRPKTTWRKEITAKMLGNGESWSDIESLTISDAELDEKIILGENGCGGRGGSTFTVWSVGFVYFPACYDGEQWVACVPRHPNGQPTDRVGSRW